MFESMVVVFAAAVAAARLAASGIETIAGFSSGLGLSPSKRTVEAYGGKKSIAGLTLTPTRTTVSAVDLRPVQLRRTVYVRGPARIFGCAFS